MVPDELSLPEAIEYAKDHMSEIELGEMEYLPFEDEEIDEWNCSFEGEAVPCNPDCSSLIACQEEYDDEDMGFCGALGRKYIGSMDEIREGNCSCVLREMR